MTIHITKARALELLREVVAERGEDFVYQRAETETCTYTFDGKPDCGVGLALFKAGVPIQDLELLDAAEGYIPAASSIHDHLSEDVVTFGVQAVNVFQEFQGWQDDGKTYGTALRRTERYATQYV